MIDKIVAQIKTGAIKNVVPYGSGALPQPPYVVVRPVADGLGRGTMYRIFVHMLPGQQLDLEDYIRDDLSDLLDGFGSETRHGNYNKLMTENEYNDITIYNDDDTISMERRFLLPTRLF